MYKFTKAFQLHRHEKKDVFADERKQEEKAMKESAKTDKMYKVSECMKHQDKKWVIP